MRKYKKLSELVPENPGTPDTLNSVRKGKADDVLQQAIRCYDSLRRYREERERCARYTYGDQWGDRVRVGNRWMTEGEMIAEGGGVPLKNNLIRRLVRTMVGVFRGQSKQVTVRANDAQEQGVSDMLATALKANNEFNQKREIDANSFKEYCISGLAIQKEVWAWRLNQWDCFTDVPDPDFFFFDPLATDLRMWDVSILGESHELSLQQVLHAFAKSPAEARRISEIYKYCSSANFRTTYTYASDRQEEHRLSNKDFLIPRDPSMCKVIEVWTKEYKPRYRCHDRLRGEMFKVEEAEKELIEQENQARVMDGVAHGMAPADVPTITMEWFEDEYWYYRFLTPSGEVLDEGESPYEHQEHPYIVRAYPFINGEIHSLVSDVIDQQRYVNRLITLNDKVIRSSAKGALLLPASAIPDGQTAEDFQAQWTRPDAVIVYNDALANGGAKPEQVANKMTNIGTTEMLQLQMGLMEEISGVQGALQGKAGFAGQSASLYAQQAQNASNGVLDLLDSFSQFLKSDARKKLYNIKQFYTSQRHIAISGKNAEVVYDPELCSTVDFDLSIIESPDTPTARAISNEVLLSLWQATAINVEQLLEFGDWPFSAALLDSIKADKEAVAQYQQAMANAPGDGASPDEVAAYLQQAEQAPQVHAPSSAAMKQVMASADPEKMAAMKSYLLSTRK